ncbi:MAG: ABC transporter permease [Cyanobacteria bacterium SZAS LIN-3]|nr:ABC transporter permease [Cyanobacteria bacterium SZAS LIN-3]
MSNEAVQGESKSLGKLGLLLYPLPLLVFVLAWHLLTSSYPDRQFTFSSPQLVWEAFVKLVSSGELLKNTGVTVMEAVCGFLMGTSSGAAIGLSFWYSKTVARIANPYITALATIPIFSLAPVVIAWFGIGLWSKIMLAFLSTVAVAIVQSYQGAMSVEPRYLKFMHVAKASRWQIFRIVVIPSALIWVINAMRLNIGLALLGAFIGEFISAEEGLGFMIVKASGLYDMATVFVGIIALVVVALVLAAGIDKVEKKLLGWRYR